MLRLLAITQPADLKTVSLLISSYSYVDTSYSLLLQHDVYNAPVSSFSNEFSQLLHRNIIFAKREPTVLVLRLLIAVFLGLLIDSVFTTDRNKKNTFGCLYILTMSLFYLGVLSSVSVFELERPVLLKEHKS